MNHMRLSAHGATQGSWVKVACIPSFKAKIEFPKHQLEAKESSPRGDFWLIKAFGSLHFLTETVEHLLERPGRLRAITARGARVGMGS